MLIRTELTPNPSSLKFVLGTTVMQQGTAYFSSIEEAGTSALAKKLFEVAGVQNILLGSDFITVTKSDTIDWSILKPSILHVLSEYLLSEETIIQELHAASQHEDEEIIQRICKLLDTRVRPAVARDGGDITFHSFHNGIVFLHLQGSCSGCPSATATLKQGVESLLRHYIPEITAVQAV